jgi:diguanylate cyclase (GGDEF)-like protein/PAS domain S-box-containing protein
MILGVCAARIHQYLAPVGLVAGGLSLGLWISTSWLGLVSRPPIVHFVGGMFGLGLLLAIVSVLLFDANARGGMSIVRQAVDRGREGQLLLPACHLQHAEVQALPGELSGRSDTQCLVVGRLRDHIGALADLLDNLSLGAVLLNGKSVVLSANSSFCRLFDLERDAVRGKKLQNLIPPALTRQWSAQAVQAVRRGADPTVETSDPSSRRLFRTRLVQVRPGKVEEALLAFFVEDLTGLGGGRVCADESREVHDLLLDSILEAVLVVRPDGSVKDMNRAATEMLGYERRQALDMNLRQFLAPGSIDDPAHRLDSYVQSGDYNLQGRRLGAVFVRADGSVFSAEVRLGEWRSGDRRLIFMSLRDVTREERANLLTRERLEVIEMISKHQPLGEVMDRLAQMIDHQMPASACVVMLRRGDRLSLAAAPNLPSSFTECLRDLPTDSSKTSCAAATLSGRTATVAEIANSAMRPDLREAALRHGLRASWSAPIVSSEGAVIGTIAVYLREPGEPASDQRELLEAAGRLASVCVEQHELTGKLAHRAHHDPLTGLPNRSAFEDHLKRAIAGAQRNAHPLGVLSIDLDRFKRVNDDLGHAAGDKVLCEVSRRLERCLRGTDIVARWGGDEFLVGLSELKDRQDALLVAGKLTEALRPPFEVDGRTIVTSATIGVSLYPDDGQDLASLMRNADRAMYRAKSAGRNSFQCYTPELGEEERHRLELENQLGGALERQELLLHYQPQFDLRTGCLAGLEALLRWQHPSLGLVLPARFISIAEESGLIVPIGAWVLWEACRQVRRLDDGGCGPVRVSANVSSIQFARPEFVELVAQALRETGIRPNLLELELTESLVMQDISQSSSRIAKLRELGVQVSIDDFGTGYSSLSYLQRLPIDNLKIDRSFIQELGDSKTGLLLVQSIVGLARSLHMVATAEGVESIAQLSASEEAGCDRVQGYLFGMPLPADQLRSLVAQSPKIRTSRFFTMMPPTSNPTCRAKSWTRPLIGAAELSTERLAAALHVAR